MTPVVGAALATTMQLKMLTQGFQNCTNLHDRDDSTIMLHELPNGMQASSYNTLALWLFFR